MDPTFLFGSAQAVIRTIEIGDQNAFEGMPQQRLRNFTATASIDLVIRPMIIDKSPEPVVDTIDLPSGFIGMLHGSVFDGSTDDVGFNSQVTGQTLKSLCNGAFGHR